LDLQNLCMGCMEDKGNAGKCKNCGFTESTTPESPYYLQPRTVLQNKYLVGRALGQGGFAITYLAWDMNLGIKLAIKEYFPLDLVYRIPGNNMVMAHSQAQDTIFVHDMEKFLQEARDLARFMEHPNIVSVTDFFQANRTAYLVMHYIEGITLRYHLSQSGEKISFNSAMGIMMPIMDAIRVIHDAGLLHRDISPENIVISQTGRVVLIDFGAARRSSGEKDQSVSVVMKPGYTPEEQYRSKGVQGPATDIYATAATIYRVITGQLPPNSLDRLEHDSLVPPSQLGVDISPEQEKALLKALSVQANNRHKSIVDFQEALLQKKIGYSDPAKTEAKKKPKPEKKAPEKEEPGKKEDPAPPAEKKQEKAFTSLGDINIGRAANNDLVLDDETASRYHAMIFSRFGKWYIADLDSSHGTYVNDQIIKEPVELVAPSKIQLSESVLHYDGKNILNEQGIVLHSLNEHVSFTERWLGGDKLSATRIIDNFLASIDNLTTRREPPQPAVVVNIGRAADNDLVLDDDMVSRYHARLFQHAGKWYLADLQSTHGTRVNEIAVEEPVQINPSDTITFSELTVRLNGERIISPDDETLYTLPAPVSASGHENRSGQQKIITDIIELFNSDYGWLIILALAGILGIIIIMLVLL